LKTENRTFFSSLFQQPTTKKSLFIYLFFLSRVRADRLHPSAWTQQPVRAGRARGYRGRAREGAGREMSSSARMRLCPCGRIVAFARTRLRTRGRAGVRADASRFTLGNFIADTIVRPSHGRPSGHHPIVRPFVRSSAIIRVTTLL
jgi:hypothetical protein